MWPRLGTFISAPAIRLMTRGTFAGSELLSMPALAPPPRRLFALRPGARSTRIWAHQPRGHGEEVHAIVDGQSSNA
jgi:hypothetical protein